MKYIFMTICTVILSMFSGYEIKPKLCIDCKFFRKYKFSNDNNYGKCSFFRESIIDDDNHYLVTGIEKDKEELYYFCSTSRNFQHMCGKEGKFYEKK